MTITSKNPNEENTGVSLKAQFTVNDVPDLLAKVIKQINNIKKDIPKTPPVVGNLDGFGKIEDIKTVDSLIKAQSSIDTKTEAYVKAAAKLIPEGKKVPPCLINGFSASAWTEAIKARMVIVYNQEELNRLEKVRKKLEDNLSAEAKLHKDLSEIANILSDE